MLTLKVPSTAREALMLCWVDQSRRPVAGSYRFSVTERARVRELSKEEIVRVLDWISKARDWPLKISWSVTVRVSVTSPNGLVVRV
jgi:hypothetical protein